LRFILSMVPRACQWNYRVRVRGEQFDGNGI
jgi:hypothetical protein